MASPLFDNLNVLLSYRIGDAVATAATDSVTTSLIRVSYLNKANNFIQLFFVGRADVERWLSGLITEQTITAFSASGFLLPTDFSYELTCKKDGATSLADVVLKPLPPHKKTALDNKTNPNNQDAFVIYGGKTYAYVNGTILSSGTGVLRYIKNDQKASAGASSDIAINSLWYDCIVDLAASFHHSDKAEGDIEAANLQRVKMILAVIS